MRGTGKADVFAMLAHPVGHAKSPGACNAFFEERGLDSLMVPVTCTPDRLEDLWTGLDAMSNLRGIIVSIPFKGKLLEKAAKAHPRASRVGAVNVMRRLPEGGWEADNFDGYGFIMAMKNAGHVMAGKKALLVGGGGGGSSIAHCLAEEGVADLTIADTDVEKVQALAAAVQANFPSCKVKVGPADPTGMDIAVNATPVGMKPADPFPMAVEGLRPGMVVYDIIMEPAETRLMAEARARGCHSHGGRPMMDAQMQAWVDFFDMDRTHRNG